MHNIAQTQGPATECANALSSKHTQPWQAEKAALSVNHLDMSKGRVLMNGVVSIMLLTLLSSSLTTVRTVV